MCCYVRVIPGYSGVVVGSGKGLYEYLHCCRISCAGYVMNHLLRSIRSRICTILKVDIEVVIYL